MPVKNLILFITAMIVISAFLLYPSFVTLSASSALYSWFNNVVPSVLPFIICVNILIKLNISKPLGKNFDTFMKAIFNLPSTVFFPVIISMLSGYPMSGKTITVLYNQGKINSDEVQRLLSFTNNPSPVFVICVVGAGLLHSPIYGRLIYISCLMGAFLTSQIIKFYYTKAPVRSDQLSICENHTDIISDSLSAILKIGAYMIFFSIISDILSLLPFIGTPLSFITEMTTGSSKITSAIINMRIKTSLLAFILSFGGICMQFQIISFLKGTPFKKYIYAISALLKASLSALFCYLFYPVFETKDISYVYNTSSANFLSHSGLSLFYITIPIALIFIIVCIKKRQV